MPTKAFDNPTRAGMSIPQLLTTLQMSSYAAPLMRPRKIEDRGIGSEADFPADAAVDAGALGRGVGWALSIECAAVLGFYVMWHLLRLLR